jgi:hypothetical protein
VSRSRYAFCTAFGPLSPPAGSRALHTSCDTLPALEQLTTTGLPFLLPTSQILAAPHPVLFSVFNRVVETISAHFTRSADAFRDFDECGTVREPDVRRFVLARCVIAPIIHLQTPCTDNGATSNVHYKQASPFENAQREDGRNVHTESGGSLVLPYEATPGVLPRAAW